MAPWSSGQDVALSRLKQGFDSPRGHQIRKSWICKMQIQLFLFFALLYLFRWDYNTVKITNK
jgi:hypothetical protein